MLSPSTCGRPNVKTSQICDPDVLLSTDDKDVIEGRINVITKIEIGISIIRQMDLRSSSSNIDDAAKQFAVSLHNRWGVGDKTTQNGVLIFASVTDRVVYISVGDGMKDKLFDAMLDHIIQSTMRPYLRRGEYGKAIEAAVVEIALICDGKGPQLAPDSSSEDYFSESFQNFAVSGFVIAIFSLTAYTNYRQNQEDRELERG